MFPLPYVMLCYSWQIFVKHLLREVCNSGLYGECHATGCDEDNAVMHHIPDNQNSTKKNRRCYIKFKEGKQVNFIPEGKHHPEMSGHVQCHPIKDGEKKRECELLLHDASQARSLVRPMSLFCRLRSNQHDLAPLPVVESLEQTDVPFTIS